MGLGIRSAISRVFLAAIAVALIASALVAASLPASVRAQTTAAAPFLRILGTPVGWSSGWVNQDVTLTVEASSATGPSLFGLSLWNPAAEDTPTALQTTSIDTTTVAVTAEGTTAVMAAGSSSGSLLPTVTATIRIDKTKPRLGYRFGVPFSSSWTSATAVPVTLVATETLSGLNGGIRFRVLRNGVWGGAEVGAPSTTFVLQGEGRYAIEASATDLAGNPSASTWTTFGVDATAPKTSWSARGFAGRAHIELNAIDSLSGIRRSYYRIDGGETRVGSSIVVTMPAEQTQPVEHRITFWSEDLAGNVEAPTAASTDVTFSINPDQTPPVTTLFLGDRATFGGPQWVSADATVTLAAFDAAPSSGIDAVYYRIDDGPVARYGKPFRLTAGAPRKFEYWSVDGNEIVETARTATVGFDSQSPRSLPDVLSIFTPIASVRVTAFDSPSGPATITAWVDNGRPIAVGTGKAGEATLTALATCDLAGTHLLHYVTSDFAGNREETRTMIVHVRRNTAFSMTSKSGSLANTSLPAKATIAGKLMDGSRPVAYKPVHIEYSASSTFAKYSSASTVTDAKGGFAFTTTLSTKTYYRMRYKGESDYGPSLSSTIKLLPRAYLSTPSASTTQRVNRTFTVSGTIKPGHSKSSVLRVKKYLLVGGKPVYKGYVTGVVTSKGTYSTYKASIKLTKGTWRLYAYMPEDSGHASSTSSKYLTVKVSP